MENAPKIAVLVVLALVVGSIFIATSKEYSKSVSDKTVEQTNNLFNSDRSRQLIWHLILEFCSHL